MQRPCGAGLVLLAALWREYGRDFRADVTLWREQLAYALPFALAVGVEVVQLNYHQYVVASRFDTATFAIYAVGCLQIPLVDMIMTSTVNVLMVKMRGGQTRRGGVACGTRRSPARVHDGYVVRVLGVVAHELS